MTIVTLLQKKSDTNYLKVAKRLQKRRISIFSSGVPQAVNGCRKLRTRLVKIASDNDQKAPVLKKRKVSPRKISTLTNANYLKLRSNVINYAFKEPPIKPLTQQEQLSEAADSTISTSVIVQAPQIVDSAATLPSQAAATIKKHHQLVQNLSVIVYSTKATSNVTDASSFACQKTTETSNFFNSTTTAVKVPFACSATIIRKTDFEEQSSVIHWIDKGVTVLEDPPAKRPHKLTTTTATTVNSDQILRFMILVRPIQRNQIELPYPHIYDKENLFRTFASIFPMLRINNDSVCVKSLHNGENQLKSASDLFEKENETIAWNKAVDKTMIHCLDENLKNSPVRNQKHFTTNTFTATKSQAEMVMPKTDDNDWNEPMVALKTQIEPASRIDSTVTLQNFTPIAPLRKMNQTEYLALYQQNNRTKKFVKIPKLTLPDRVQAKYDFTSINSIVTNAEMCTKQESLLIKLEVQPNLSNGQYTADLKNYKKPEKSNERLNLSSSIETSTVTQINPTKRSCKACSEPSVAEVPQFLFSNETCTECARLNNPKTQFVPIDEDYTPDISGDEDSDNEVTVLPANPLNTRRSTIRSISYMSFRPELSYPKITLPSRMKPHLRPKIFSYNNRKYTKFPVKKALDIKHQLNSILPRGQYATTIVSDGISVPKMQSGVHDQYSPRKSAESARNETHVKSTNSASPLTSSASVFLGFGPLHPDSEEDVDVGSDTVSCCTSVRGSTPNTTDKRIVDFGYNRQTNCKNKPLPEPPVPRNVYIQFQPAYQHHAMKRHSEPPPVMSLYASQLHRKYRQIRKKMNATRTPKLRALSMKKPVLPLVFKNVDKDSTLLRGKDNTTPERCFDDDFLAQPSKLSSESALMSLSIHDFFAEEDITLEDILTKYL